MEKKSIGKELRSLNNVIKRYVENLNNYQSAKNVTGTNSWIIAFLADNQHREIYQKDLEKQFSVTRSTASKVIKRMEEKGMLCRVSVPEDARLKKLVLTQTALDMHNAIIEDLQKMESNLTDGFDPDELKTLHSYIVRMKKNLEHAFQEEA
ncbi:MarR family transcriptional regulator [Alkalibacter rhizosphaerae]|uniref:MarR family transcriptional regulator n=1 Tax=Alkalibacter rhizosphaerae TaxID=2815577 RepID=A0A974XDB6_9FIRM|nr:MarR family transcriptional regulator [Alkalibacter rhizosphaerae]QSX07631.1 MarR family transcriptional regulator [Alkalibacter rhizosphaerae]